MTTHTQATLQRAAQHFIAAYRANARLVDEQRDWNCAIGLPAADTNDCVALHIRDGLVESCATSAASRLVEVEATLEILERVLTLRLNPNEPYLFGDLVVRGDEKDFVRLDYVCS